MRGRGRDGEALAKEMVVFCHIHFTRGVDEALKRAGGVPLEFENVCYSYCMLNRRKDMKHSRMILLVRTRS